MGEKVILDWMGKLTWRQQSTIIASSRGPDTHYCPNIKKITAWIRRITQQNGNLHSSYMAESSLPSLKDIKKEFEFCSIHYGSHFLHGLAVIGYKHPDKAISKIARDYYTKIVREFLHLNPETKKHIDKRLEDLV